MPYSVTPVCWLHGRSLIWWWLSPEPLLNQTVVQPPLLPSTVTDSSADSTVSGLPGEMLHAVLGHYIWPLSRMHTFTLPNCAEIWFFLCHRWWRKDLKRVLQVQHETHVDWHWLAGSLYGAKKKEWLAESLFWTAKSISAGTAPETTKIYLKNIKHKNNQLSFMFSFHFLFTFYDGRHICLLSLQ